jgi:hypothetical protein
LRLLGGRHIDDCESLATADRGGHAVEPILESLDVAVYLLGIGLAIVAVAVGTWVFRMRRHN